MSTSDPTREDEQGVNDAAVERYDRERGER
jgi:hypothetical protein